jgi:hypothetical protein
LASPRKRYQARVESSDKDAPVAALPQESAARPPEPAADPKPPEMPTAAESDPVGEAERSALRQRLAEMDRAATAQEAMRRQPQYATEPPRPQQVPEVPAQVQEWLSKNPHYLTDAVAQAELQLATLRSLRDGRTWADDDFIDVLERHLGMSQQQTQPQPNGNSEPVASPKPAPSPRNGTPQRPVVQRQGAPVSAPPTREVPSMTTGRPVSDVRLTVEEVQLAKSLGISEDEYRKQKIKMRSLQSAGVIQDGR